MWKCVCLMAGIIATALANTEKAIFLGPKPVNIPPTHPNLEDLRIDSLRPGHWAIRTHVEAQFPSATAKFGKATWLVLDELTDGQRYELRVCWAATQPTAFRINTYELETVFGTPELILELSEYSYSRQSGEDESSQGFGASKQRSKSDREASVLLLQVLAAADYFTTNNTLMNDVPPVFVDIILDPYVFNVLPRSLVPTVGYIVAVAVLSWFLARRISVGIRRLAKTPEQTKKDQ
ncbi:hypothetical protein SCAR479_00504 [Seiridium cardinale]|uniref:Uncharacterized protein n=1 Tax=Seiridium cardinale TaxID=138064 RepID=A0ABR2Y9P7_9PEZI